MNKETELSPLVYAMPVSNRTSDEMTLDDLWRARAIAQVLDEPNFIAKLDAELAKIYAAHHAIKTAMDYAPPTAH